MMDYYSEKKCYRCSGTEIFIDNKRGDVVCQICGEVLSGRIIDDSNEWNIYADDDRSSTDFIARAGRSIKDPIFDCNTTTVGGTNEKRKSLIVSQIKLEGNINHKASKSRDILFRVAGLLHLTPSIQVSVSNLTSFY